MKAYEHESSFLKSFVRFFLVFILSAMIFLLVTALLGQRSYLPLVSAAVVGFLVINWLNMGFAWQGATVLSVVYLALKLSGQELGDGGVQLSLAMITGAYILIQIPTLFTRVPFYPTKTAMLEALGSYLGNVKKDFTFVDLGSGFGGVVFPLAKKFPLSKFVGYELAPLPYLNSKVLSFLYPNVIVRYRNFWNDDLSDYDFIYAFLSPEAAPKLERKFYDKVVNNAENSTLLVHSFKLERKESQVVKTSEGELYIYQL
jgi:hypothetical protein